MPPEDEVLLETDDVRVRILHLSVGGVTPEHYHTEVTDHIVCLEGQIEIRLQTPEEDAILNPGERIEIPPRRVHTVINLGARSSKYLLVQGVGKYDFVRL